MKKLVKVIQKIVALSMILGLVVGCTAQDSKTTAKEETVKKSDAGVSSAAGENSTDTGDRKLKFGYVLNDMSHEWYQNIVKGAQSEAAARNIELKVSDAAMDVAKQVTQLENYINEGVDVLMITPVDVKALAPVMAQAKAANIVVVTESNVVEGAATYVGIDNYAGGQKAGKWFAEYAKENNIDPKILIVGLESFEDCRMRVQGFKDAMDEAGLAYTIKQEVDGQGSKEISLKVSQDAFTANPDVNVVFGINDNSTTGAMAAYKEAGLDESKLTAIGFGFEGNVGREALLAGGSFKAALGMFPDYVGVSLLKAAEMAAKGETLPANYESGTVMITMDNFADFYTKEGDTYVTNFDAISALLEK